MPTYIYNPYQASISRPPSTASNDLTCPSGYFIYRNAAVTRMGCTVGFNGTPTSMNLTLVNDPAKGLNFSYPTVPSLVGIGLPEGGVGQAAIYPSGVTDFGYGGSNGGMYWAGLVTACQEDLRNISGKLVNVQLTDPREILRGVQVILNGVALSSSIGAGSQQFYSDNIVDVYGFYDYGMDSDRNPYGMKWNDIRFCLENVRVKLFGIFFEFAFQGSGLAQAPDFYRIDADMMDMMSLLNQVCQDSGQDLNCFTYKISSTEALVEFRATDRTAANALTSGEIGAFISDRDSIVISASRSREFRNEPTSSVIVGGAQNANYVAWPSQYHATMHTSGGKESYNRWCADIVPRLFGGSYTDGDGNSGSNNGAIGAIFPFWGFAPRSEIPMAEPFLSLDHLVFDRDTSEYADLKSLVPICKIETQFANVRTVPHTALFLDDDGDADERPWGVVTDIQYSSSDVSGYNRGLPLNTEVLRAAMTSERAFAITLATYYPDVASGLTYQGIDWSGFKSYLDNTGTSIYDADIYPFMDRLKTAGLLPTDSDAARLTKINKDRVLTEFRKMIYSLVRAYTEEHCGSKFIVCLPKSQIMNRIWAGSGVPTNSFFPEIEYVVDNRGYWQEVPSEFDGLASGGSTELSAEQEEQIRYRFMAEDGRFAPMVFMDWKPSGNACFNANGLNKVMFQDLSEEDFRPNRIADGNPNWVAIAPKGIEQLPRRPDLALVTISPVLFDPTDGVKNILDWQEHTLDDEPLVRLAGFAKLIYRDARINPDAQAVMGSYPASEWPAIVRGWHHRMVVSRHGIEMWSADYERCMDVKAITIPLTSTRVSYGPYYFTAGNAKDYVTVQVVPSLVPWNYDRATPWYTNLDAAGFELLDRTLADIEVMHTANIAVAGYPEYSPGDKFLGKNSNITGLSVEFSVNGVVTRYDMSTYLAKPGTYRKSEYDNLERARIDTRPELPVTRNVNLRNDIAPKLLGAYGEGPVNRFGD